MSRTPLKTSLPDADAKLATFCNDSDRLKQAEDDVKMAQALHNSLLLAPHSSCALIKQAEANLPTTVADRDAIRLECQASKDAHLQAALQKSLCLIYLQEFKDKRNPILQLDTFPHACGTTLDVLIAYLIHDLNNVLADIKTGKKHWRFAAPAAITTNDLDLCRTIRQQKEKLNISFCHWRKHKGAFGMLYDRLKAAGFTITRPTKP